MKKVLGMGNALIDNLLLVENEDLLQEFSLPKGSMQLIDTARYCHIRRRTAQLAASRTTGGSACNTILAIAHLGGSPGLIGKVGRDDLGQTFAQACADSHVMPHLFHHDTLPTGVASTFITPDGQRTFATYLGAAATLEAAELNPQWFEGYDIFYIEGYLVQNHALIEAAVRLARQAGLTVCIDLASYNVVEAERDFFLQLLTQTDIVFANEQEAEALTGSNRVGENLEYLAKLCCIAVLKVGKDGVWVRRGDVQLHHPAREVEKVVDTTAAGDYFSAGFLHAYTLGASPEECAALGSFLAGHIVEVVGTALPEATWQSIRNTLAAGLSVPSALSPGTTGKA